MSTRFLALLSHETADSVDMRDIPEPWLTAMASAHVVDPRRGQPSMSQLGQRLGVHTSTVTAMIFGDRATSLDTVQRTADILSVDARTVHAWVGRARAEREPYKAPAEANLLDKDQRRVVSGLIRLMARYAPVVALDAVPDVEVEPVDLPEHKAAREHPRRRRSTRR